MSEPLVRGTDFVTVSAKDFDVAVDFYRNTLGLPLSARYGEMPGAEFETGNLTLAVLQSEPRPSTSSRARTTTQSHSESTTSTPPAPSSNQRA